MPRRSVIAVMWVSWAVYMAAALFQLALAAGLPPDSPRRLTAVVVSGLLLGGGVVMGPWRRGR